MAGGLQESVTFGPLIAPPAKILVPFIIGDCTGLRIGATGSDGTGVVCLVVT